MIETTLTSEQKPPINLNDLIGARQRALSQGVSVIQALEDSGSYTPDELTQQLGQLLHMPVLENCMWSRW